MLVIRCMRCCPENEGGCCQADLASSSADRKPSAASRFCVVDAARCRCRGLDFDYESMLPAELLTSAAVLTWLGA